MWPKPVKPKRNLNNLANSPAWLLYQFTRGSAAGRNRPQLLSLTLV
jgi:hypothetical protein